MWPAAAFLALATLVWSSGDDMFFGLMLLLVLGGWGLLGLFGVASFVHAARSGSPRWLTRWALVWLGFAYCPAGTPAGFTDLGGGLYKYTYDYSRTSRTARSGNFVRVHPGLPLDVIRASNGQRPERDISRSTGA